MVVRAAVDAEGYLVDLDDWSAQVAAQIAAAEGIALTDEHWAVIELVRDFYDETGISLAMRPLVKLARDNLGPDFGNSIALMKLFPGSPAKLVAKIGGLPRPTKC